MTKVHGKRYAYKFDFHALMQACQTQGHEHHHAHAAAAAAHHASGYKGYAHCAAATDFSLFGSVGSSGAVGAYGGPKSALNGLFSGAASSHFHHQVAQASAHQASLFAPPPSAAYWHAHAHHNMTMSGMNSTLSNYLTGKHAAFLARVLRRLKKCISMHTFRVTLTGQANVWAQVDFNACFLLSKHQHYLDFFWFFEKFRTLEKLF